MQRVLLTGAAGQLGRSVQAQCPAHWQLLACTRQQLDVTDARQIRAVMQAFQPQVVINAAAYNAVDAAESDPAAWAVNALGPALLAQQAVAVGARLVHVSTDYVFDGQASQPYAEQTVPRPVNQYGASKWVGEQAVLAGQPQAVVVRTSWVFSQHAPNFVQTVLQAARQGREIRMTTDQFSAPTYAGHLANVLIRLINTPTLAGGIYHYCDQPALSRFDYAAAIVQGAQMLARQAGQPAPVLGATLVPVTQAHWSGAALRPVYSALSCTRLAGLGIASQDWRPVLSKVVA